MLHTKFQVPETSSSGEEDFEVYFIFEPKTPPPPPATGPFWTPGPPFDQTWQRSIRQCYIPNIKALGLAVSEEMLFKAIVDDGRRTTDDGHWPMTIAHPEPMAQMS